MNRLMREIAPELPDVTLLTGRVEVRLRMVDAAQAMVDAWPIARVELEEFEDAADLKSAE